MMAARLAGAFALALALGGSAGAAEPWLTVDAGARCSVGREALAARVLDALVGERAAGLSVHVALDAQGGSVAASVRVARGARELGQTRLVAPSCGEAIDAVVAVAALAVGAAPSVAPRSAPTPRPSSSTSAPASSGEPAPESSSREPAPESSSREPASPEPSRETASPEPASPAETDRGATPESTAIGRRFRVVFAAGADQGVLSSATAVVGAGAALGLGEQAEWRALLWYGLPASDEREDSGVGLEKRRSDFAAASLDYCRRMTAAGWWSLCGGFEARVARLARVEDAPDLARIEREQLAASGAARAGLGVVYRELAWQPRLELGAQVPVVGTSADTGWVGFRASLGGSLPF
jgi:hypothetical protein